MTQRSRAREVALQLLFQRDLNPSLDRASIETFVQERLRDAKLRPYTLSLYDGVVAHQDEIDKRLSASAQNWRVARMAAVDRNVLRLGSFELLFDQATPQRVVFDEAIQLARPLRRRQLAQLRQWRARPSSPGCPTDPPRQPR